MSVAMINPLLSELFKKEQAYLNHFFETLDMSAVDSVLQEMLNCRGMIVLTGVGKSGIVAKKMAVTMTSTGTRAIALSPTNALHGDIGIIHKEDLLVILSKSGESDELLNLIPFVRNKGVKVVALVSDPGSRVAKAVDLVIQLPSERELCPFDMAPTTSTTIQGIVGDVLAISLMRLKNVSIEDFAQSHPAGRLGKRITLTVKDLMVKENKIPLCGPKDKLVDTLVELSNKQCGCVLVVDEEQKLLGIFTDGDLRRSLQENGAEALESTMDQLMIKNPRAIGPNVLAYDAMKAMEFDQKHPIMVLPVLDEAFHVLGVIKMHDLVQTGV